MRRERGRPHWGGRFQLGIGQALYVGPAFDTTPHAHHALQLCIALDGTFALRGPGRARWRRYAAALVAADHPHQLSGEGRTVCVLYLEPESARGRRLETVLDGRGLIDLTPRARSLRGPLVVLADAKDGEEPGELLGPTLTPEERDRLRGEVGRSALPQQLREPAVRPRPHRVPGRRVA